MKSDILTSWKENAHEWSRVIRNNDIASRVITNPAIVETVINSGISTVCDLGCGEGWLTKALLDKGLKATGIDGTKELILQAQNLVGESAFHHFSFEQIITGITIPRAPYEAAVLNFCLYEKNLTESLLNYLPALLIDPKLIFIQTLHPISFLKNEQNMIYKDQWIEDSWKGLKGNFKNGHQWYYRTFAGWHNLFKDCNLRITQIQEPVSKIGEPLSIIFSLTSD